MNIGSRIPARSPVLSLAGLIAAIGCCTPALAQPVTQNNILLCDTGMCGGYAQNVATMVMTQGSVTVDSAGLVQVSIIGLRDRTTSAPKTNTSLAVSFGSFTTGAFKTASVGTLVTDGSGNFVGALRNSAGQPASLPAGNHAGSFIFNDSARSQFISGFSTGTPIVYIKVPSVIGEEVLDAKANISSVGLTPKIAPGNPDGINATVTGQSPAKDTFLAKGQPVTLYSHCVGFTASSIHSPQVGCPH